MSGNLFRNGMMVLALLAAMSTPAFAKTYSYSTLQNVTDLAGEPVWGIAKFDIVSANSMIITLTNNESNITSVGQNISSLWFTVNNGSSILSLSGASVTLSGNLVYIGTPPPPNAPTSLNNVSLGTKGTSTEHWSAGQGSSQFYFNDLNGGGQPHQTIIGPGNYSTVNSSIYGSGPHNPFIQNQATFTITTPPGVLADATISNVQIGFGTCKGDNLRTVPEPGSLALLAIGALAFAGVLRRKTVKETHA